MRPLIRTAAAAALIVLGLSACSSTDNGAPEGDTVSLPSNLQTSTPVYPPTSANVNTPTPVATQTLVTTTTATSATSAPKITIKPAPKVPVREAIVTAANGTTVYDIKIWAEVTSPTCANHAYGAPVVQYLTANPCAGMTRLLATTVVGGRPVGFAQTSLGFIGTDPTVYETAEKFASIEDSNNTGSIEDLLHDGYRLPDGPSKIPASEAFTVESQDAGVTIVDAFYLDGPTPNQAPALIQMAKDIFLQF
jgi:hypothetical protein